MKRDELQNQFKNQDLNTVDPAAFLENGGGAPIQINLTIGEVIVSTQVIGPGETLGIALTSKSIDKNTPLAVAVVSGAAGDLTTKCAYLLTSQ